MIVTLREIYMYKLTFAGLCITYFTMACTIIGLMMAVIHFAVEHGCLSDYKEQKQKRLIRNLILALLAEILLVVLIPDTNMVASMIATRVAKDNHISYVSAENLLYSMGIK